MSFQEDMDRFVRKVHDRHDRLFRACVNHAERSIKVGSSVTGAPGQPVKTGALLKSWRTVRGKRKATIASYGVYYAPIIEDNRRGAQLRSKVGGFHSVKLTRNNWNKLVRHELNKIKGAEGLTAPTASTFYGSGFDG